MSITRERKKLTILVPVFNEEENIFPFLEELLPVLKTIAENNLVWNVLFIDDGSKDNTLNLISLANQDDSRVGGISLSRNFGKEAAVTCGLENAKGDAIVIMDVDLQHPPQLIPQLVDLWRNGYNMVIPLNTQRMNQSVLYKYATGIFYSLMDKMCKFHIPRGGSDFRLMDRKVVEAIKLLPEKNRFMKTLYAYPGFKVKEISYSVRERKYGVSSWNYWKLWNFALDGLLGTSSMPLKIWAYVGGGVSLLSFLYLIYIIAKVALHGKDVPGWPTIISLVLFFNGLTMLNNGILGEYVARIFEEVKQRPLYFIETKIGLEEDSAE